MESHEHPFSWEALRRIVLMALGVYLAWRLGDIFVIILIALVFAAALYPPVNRLHKKLPMLVSILIILLGLLIPFVAIGFLIIPTLVNQFPNLVGTINNIVSKTPYLPSTWKNFNILHYIQTNTAFLISSTETTVVLIVSAITVVVLAFYFLYDFERLFELFITLFPRREKNKVKAALAEISVVTGQYIRGNIIISLICSIIIFLGLFVLRVPYALPLAIFSGLADLLPLIGSTVGAIPALIVGFSVSPTTGLFVLILHLAYQQLENAIISPAIYNKALNLSPSLSFLAVLIGGGLFGIVGAFLALPVAASLPVILRYQEDYDKRN